MNTTYFDNAATTFPKPEEVYKFMDTFYREYGVNIGRSQYKLALTASKLVSETRDLLLNLFHCPNKRVVFTHTATEALNVILQGITYKDNYNIYISPFEHNSVTRVIHHLKSIYKVSVYILSVNKQSLEYDLEKIKYQFDENKPNVVIISHASNVCGVISPIKEICELSKKNDAITVLDMCQTAGLIDSDLSSQIYDYAVFAGHKTLYGPLGIAGFICYGNIDLLPILFGGTGVDSANQDMPDTIPEKYEVASPNIMAIAGLNASLKWINRIGITTIYNIEKYNHRRLLDILNTYENIKVINPLGENIGVVSCVFNEYSPDNIGQVLSEKDIAVRTGLHCAPYAHQFLGTYPAGTVRFSVGYFNTDDDFDKLHNVLTYIEQN